MEKQVIIRKGIQMGATIGAFMYAYYVNFKGNSNASSNYFYTVEATEEGMGAIVAGLKEAGYTPVYQKVNGEPI